MGYLLIIVAAIRLFCGDVFWGIVLALGGVWLVNRPSRKNDKAKSNNELYKRHFWDLESEIFRQCFDQKTCVFHWDTWFDRRDEIVHSAPDEVLEGIDSDFRACGRQQVGMINSLILNHILSGRCGEGARKLLYDKIIPTGILVSLHLMYSSKGGEFDKTRCPTIVNEYQQLLLDYLRTESTADNVQRAWDLGQKIIHGLSY